MNCKYASSLYNHKRLYSELVFGRNCVGVLMLVAALLLFPISTTRAQVANISGAEYFWNTDPGYGNGTPISITAGQNVDFSVNIPCNTLTPGLNRYFVRVKNTAGKWSQTYNGFVWITSVNALVNPQLVSVEYFWDTDPGLGSGTPLTVTPGSVIDLTATINASALTSGMHFFGIRTKDNNGEWSHTYNSPVWISPPLTNMNPQLVSVEYFWDTDPGQGSGTPLTVAPGSAIDLTATISASALSAGMHRFYIRTKDNNGEWSHTYNSPVWISPPLTSLNPQLVSVEYFWDTDPGLGSGTSLTVTPGSAIDLTATINASALSTGMHRFYIRTKDDNGEWSHTYSSPVWINPAVNSSNPQIVSVEYFWDTDPGSGSGTPLTATPGTTIDLSATISASGLTAGIHRFYIRAKDDNGLWSHTYSSPVWITPPVSGSNPLIVSGEYFWDTDPGFGSGTALSSISGNVIDLTQIMSTSGLTLGIHRLYIRTKDNSGKWSHTYSSPVWITPPVSGSNPLIVSGEYFWDTDPGFGSGTALSSISGNVIDLTQIMSTSGLTLGIHRLYIRTKDNSGKWSHAYSSPVWITPPVSGSNPLIVSGEYFWDTDPGFGSGTALSSISGNVIDLTQIMSTSGLTLGIHRLYIRTKDDNAKWSHTYSSPVWITPPVSVTNPLIVSGEYFWDTDPGFGSGTALSAISGNVIDLTQVMNTTGLPLGIHRVYIRTKDNSGRWSHSYSSPVWITANTVSMVPLIVAAEYFWDTDPGFGAGQSLPITMINTVIDENSVVALCGLTTGAHKLYIRVKDDSKKWSHCLIKDVTVTNNGQPSVLSISISIAANPSGTTCAGTPVTFTAAPVNAGTSTLQWKVNGVNVGYNSLSYTTTTLSNNDIVSCVLTSNSSCASPSVATSNALTMSVNPAITPSVLISASPSPTGSVCAGTAVTFTAAPTNGGTPVYQWKLNGSNVGSNSISYVNAGLANNDVILCVMTSNASCVSPATATSNSITMTVTPVVVPSVSINPSIAGAICAGTAVTFIASPINGGTPSYQWKRNGIDVGTNAGTYVNAALANNDVVLCVMTSNANCASPAIATSNAVTMTVNPMLTPSISVSASANPSCLGFSDSYTANISAGGTTPVYQWKVNGSNQGLNSSTFSYQPSNSDQVLCVLTSNETCVYSSTATSNSVSMSVSACPQSWIGVVDSNWNVSANWSGGQVPLAGANVSIPSGMPHQPVITAAGAHCDSLFIASGAMLALQDSNAIDVYGNWVMEAGSVFIPNKGSVNFKGSTTLDANSTLQLHDLFVNPGNSLSIVGNDVLKISGDFINNGSFIPGVSKIVFDGNLTQSIKMNGAAFYKVVFDNTAAGCNDITLQDNLTFTDSAAFIQGVLNYGVPSARFTVPDNAVCNSGNAGSYVNGEVVKQGNDAFIFPIGDCYWAPLGIDAPSVNSSITAVYYAAAAPNSSDPADLCNGGGLDHANTVEYWDVTTDNAHPQVTLYWKDGTRSNIYSLVQTELIHWEDCGGTNKWMTKTGQKGGTVSDGWIKSAGVSSYSPFTFGTSVNTPLPVTIVNFEAGCTDNVVNIQWLTASETNSNYFEIESSDDLLTWKSEGKVAAAGNSNELRTYSYLLPEQKEGGFYLRLKQFDFDGMSYIYGPVRSDCNGNESQVELFPNPTDGWITVIGATPGVELNIVNSMGQLIRILSFDDMGHITVDLNLPSGVYYLQGIDKGTTINKKIVLY